MIIRRLHFYELFQTVLQILNEYLLKCRINHYKIFIQNSQVITKRIFLFMRKLYGLWALISLRRQCRLDRVMILAYISLLSVIFAVVQRFLLVVWIYRMRFGVSIVFGLLNSLKVFSPKVDVPSSLALYWHQIKQIYIVSSCVVMSKTEISNEPLQTTTSPVVVLPMKRCQMTS